jgi:hypothetical protein
MQRELLSLASYDPELHRAKLDAYNRRKMELYLDGEPMACAETQAEKEVFGAAQS